MDIDLAQLRKPCACGKTHELVTEKILIERGAAEELTDILENFQNPVFLCDSNTRAAAEPYLEEEFKDYPIIEMKPKKLEVDNRGIRKVMKQLDYCDRGLSSVPVDVLVAIGSGTIHDLTRYAAKELDIPFISIPTAASVDGYAANVISVIWNGVKKTLPGPAPRWILADTNIFARAPAYLTSSGAADLLCKYTALLDWRVAHLVTGEYICEEVCGLIERAVREVERELDDIRKGDWDAIEKLMQALILCGLAMQMTDSPRPVSGAEHMAAYVWDMGVMPREKKALHGEEAGVGLVLVTDYYKWLGHMIRHRRVRIKEDSAKAIELELLENTFPDPNVRGEILAANDPNPLAAVDLKRFSDSLDEIAELIRDLPPDAEMQDKLRRAGAPASLAEIGLSEDVQKQTLAVCSYVRPKMTLLRLSKLLEFL